MLVLARNEGEEDESPTLKWTDFVFSVHAFLRISYKIARYSLR